MQNLHQRTPQGMAALPPGHAVMNSFEDGTAVDNAYFTADVVDSNPDRYESDEKLSDSMINKYKAIREQQDKKASHITHAQELVSTQS